MTQGAIGALLRCHKSWVCRRLMLVEALDTDVQADVRLGLIAQRAALLLAALPRGNQSSASAVVVGRGLTVRQTALLVRELGEASEPEAVLTRWRVGRRPEQGDRGRSRRSVAEIIAFDVTAIRRSAGRLQACLGATPLSALGPAVDAVGRDLGELRGVLDTLTKTIGGAIEKAAKR